MYLRDGCWYSDFRHDGVRHTKSWGKISKTVATEKDRKYRTEVLEGKRPGKAKRITFEAFTVKYLEYARIHKKPKSVKRNQVSINMLTPYLKGKLIGAIHAFMVEQYKKARREEGREPGTINRDVNTLRNMLRKAVEWGYLSRNPLAEVKQLREDNERMWVLTPEEETRLLEACGKSPQRGSKKNPSAKYLRDLVLFGLHSGMRLNEIFSVKKTEIDMERRFILVSDTKNGQSRMAPINATLQEIIERRLHGTSEHIFCNSKGTRLTVLTNAFWHAVKEAKLIRVEVKNGETIKTRFRFHDCRHTFGSRLGMAGTDLKTIMEIMGHKTTRVAMRYQHPMPGHKLDAVKNLDQVPSVFTTVKEEPKRVVNLFR